MYRGNTWSGSIEWDGRCNTVHAQAIVFTCEGWARTVVVGEVVLDYFDFEIHSMLADMVTWHDSLQRRAWRPYIEASLLLETRLDEDLRVAAGMGLMDYHVLLVLSECPAHRLRMGELAARMVFSPSRLTYQVKAMERRGWVLRQPSGEDKRVHYAVLTATGLEAYRQADHHHIETVQRLFTDDVDEQELQVLRRVFTRLQARLHGGGNAADAAAIDDSRTVE